jgi:4-hydroxybenzoate polyprenyltransferase/phosphoserine phosphatase
MLSPQATDPVADVPLCVDLDGTLVKTDTLYESLVALARKAPLQLLRVPLWLWRGRAALKRELALRALPDARLLPYRHELVAYLQAERERGRLLILATGADEGVARAVAAHLGLFAGVLGSDGKRNLSGRRKLAELRAFGHFDYAGDSRVDLPLWRQARRAIVVGASPRLVSRARGAAEVERVFAPVGERRRTLTRALRIHQWAKNVLIFVPLLAAHRLLDHSALARTALAFIAFCLSASAGYLLNDMLDLDADRRDLEKRHRPLASGAMSIRAALLWCPTLLGAGLLLGARQSRVVAALLLLHFVATTLYSLRWKRVLVLDVLVLAGLYTLRIFTGAAAAHVRVSPWLLGASMFMFLSLALVKRASELRRLNADGHAAAPGRGYQTRDLGIMTTLGGASGYLTVLVLALYIQSPDVTVLYPHPERLWGLSLLLLYWFSRIWILTSRGEIDSDPVAFALKDRCSHAVGLLGLAVAYLAS